MDRHYAQSLRIKQIQLGDRVDSFRPKSPQPPPERRTLQIGSEGTWPRTNQMQFTKTYKLTNQPPPRPRKIICGGCAQTPHSIDSGSTECTLNNAHDSPHHTISGRYGQAVQYIEREPHEIHSQIKAMLPPAPARYCEKTAGTQ